MRLIVGVEKMKIKENFVFKGLILTILCFISVLFVFTSIYFLKMLQYGKIICGVVLFCIVWFFSSLWYYKIK